MKDGEIYEGEWKNKLKVLLRIYIIGIIPILIVGQRILIII